MMKFIITETQEQKIYVLRRLSEDWDWIRNIVEEGLDMYSPCDIDDVDDYVIKVARDSANTYLLNYIDDWKSDTFTTLLDYVSSYIEDKLYKRIFQYYYDYKEDCNEEQ